ncbi:MFS transporter [Candidatus Marithrix sp. Canyon 246]|uniref:MFS transporter n=1 Tax=Candidatus Marithrix sp. Canyon 246 TaxID=1827136 RepID=UPI00084A28AF|nr:MFS transporter [Candidatus Marithrix sp. Canyon 246]
MKKNLVLDSFLIIFWLVFKPSAWRRYITNIDSDLAPNFALANLKLQHWRNYDLQKLLILGHALWGVWITAIVAIVLMLLSTPSDKLILISCYTLFLVAVGGFLSSMLISVAFGIIAGAMAGLLLSIPMAMGDYQLEQLVVFNMVENIAIAVLLNTTDAINLFQSHDSRSFYTIILAIFTASCAATIMLNTNKTTNAQKYYHQIGSVTIGIFVSAIAIFIIAFVVSILAPRAALMLSTNMYVMAYDGMIAVLFGFAITIIWALLTLRWKPALLIGVSALLLLTIFTWLKNYFSNPILIGVHGGIENAMLYILLFAFPYVLATKIANTWAGILAGILGSGGTYVVFAIITQSYALTTILPWTILALVAGLTVNWWRPFLLYPFEAVWNIFICRAYERRKTSRMIRWHSAFWDELQYIPLYGLENFLVKITERYPRVGKNAIEYLSVNSQAWAAKEAQIELDARRLQNNSCVEGISKAHLKLAAGELEGSTSALLRSFSRISLDVQAALEQKSKYNQRLVLNKVEASLDGLLRELTRSSEAYAIRFRPIAETWRHTIADHLKVLSEIVEANQEIINPYVIALPLTEDQEIFVGRSGISERIERLLLDKRRPPLFLYGQRRTGKTSLLNNLSKLLPTNMIPLFVDLQGPPASSKDFAGFLYNISRAMLNSAKRHRKIILPVLTREKLTEDPFSYFDEWLDEIEQELDENQTFLLMLDEFSVLDFVLAKGLLDEALVLGMFRHIIQHRPRIKMLLSDSSSIDEFERWASYLINVQTVHISYLETEEALQLITQPIPNFTLCYEEDASQRVLTITRGHPALTQLLCSEIVNLKNKQDISIRHLVQISDVEAAIPGALQNGGFFLSDIRNSQVKTKTALAMLKYIAAKGEAAIVSEAELQAQFPEDFEASKANLLQRELIEATGKNAYRFQVELIRRYF